MSGSIVTFPVAHAARQPAGAAIREHILRFAASLKQEWRLRRDLAQLQNLDARGLHDIGLTGGGLEGAVRHGRRSPTIGRELPGRISLAAERPEIPSSWTEWR